MRFLVFLFLACLLSAPAFGAEAQSGDRIQLKDGRIVRLLGIKAEGHESQNVLQSLIADKDVQLESVGTDRYGRIAADVYIQSPGGKKTWLQGELLRQGLAFVYPPTGSEPHLEELLQAERSARTARRGLWNDPDYAGLPADKPYAIAYGRYSFVQGKVLKAERIKDKVYLNFGPDWHTDFTVAIAAHDLHLFRKQDIDPLDYEGKTIRVRGWVKRSFGPMITVTHPAQIESQ